MSIHAGSRRSDYAEATRLAIIEAARSLFARQGYFATKVDEIARVARVAPGTVYAAGGKQGLLRLLVEQWADAPVLRQSLERLPTLNDPQQVLEGVATYSRTVREEHGDVMRVLLTTAPHDEMAAAALQRSTNRYRRTLAAVARHLESLGGLAEGISTALATDVLWFYFGYSGYFTLLDDNKWPMDSAEAWLLEQCSRALLPDATRAGI